MLTQLDGKALHLDENELAGGPAPLDLEALLLALPACHIFDAKFTRYFLYCIFRGSLSVLVLCQRTMSSATVQPM